MSPRKLSGGAQSACHFRKSAIALALASSFTGPALAAPVAGDPLTGEFIVNSQRPGNQLPANVAMDADGDFVVVYNSYGADGVQNGVYARRFDPTGAALTPEILVTTSTSVSTFNLDVASDAAGNFAVMWNGADHAVQVQRFDAVGDPLGDRIRINDITATTADAFAIAMDAVGDFAVVWGTYDGFSYEHVLARAYNAAGQPTTDQIPVEPATTSLQFFGKVGMDADGDFAVAWTGYTYPAFDRMGAYTRVFAANGAALTDVIPVHEETSRAARVRAMTMNPAGKFIVGWRINFGGTQLYDMFLSPFDRFGNRGAEIALNTTTTGNQLIQGLAMDAQGGFVASWTSQNQDGAGYGAYMRRFNAAGVALTDEVQMNTTTTGDQSGVHVALDADGDMVATWTGPGQDGDGSGAAIARRYAGYENVDLGLSMSDSDDPAASGQPLTYRFAVRNLHAASTFTGRPAIDGAIGAATGIHVSGTLAAGSTINSAGGSGWSCSFSAPAFACDYGLALAAGATNSGLTVVTVNSAAGTTISSSASVSGLQPDATTSNDSDIETTILATPDSTPDAFSFSDRSEVATGTVIVSSAVRLVGFNTGVPISLSGVAGASYSINGGAYVTGAGTAHGGDVVRLRLTSSAAATTTVTATLDAGGVTAQWNVTTGATDTTPDATHFGDRTGVATGILMVSNVATLGGFDGAVPISLPSGPAQRKYSINSGAYVSDPGTVVSGDTLRLQVKSPTSANTTFNTAVNVGGVTDVWTVTTGAADTTPDPFDFADVTGAARNTPVTSVPLVIGGFNAPVPISIAGAATRAYSINGGTFVSGPGTLNPGDSVALRLTAAALKNKAFTITFSVGGVKNTWSVTTAP